MNREIELQERNLSMEIITLYIHRKCMQIATSV